MKEYFFAYADTIGRFTSAISVNQAKNYGID